MARRTVDVLDERVDPTFIEGEAKLEVVYVCTKRCEYWSITCQRWFELWPGDAVRMPADIPLQMRSLKKIFLNQKYETVCVRK